MIPLYTRAQVRAMDEHAAKVLGVPSLVLMENAGRGATTALLERFRPANAPVAVVCGTGQNGGDGWVVARHLHSESIRVSALLVGEESKINGDAQSNLKALRAAGVVVHNANAQNIENHIKDACVWVDALFGTGLDRPIAGAMAEAIQALNHIPVPCFALDVPSGIDADTGQVHGIALRARATATFGAHKKGLFQLPGQEHAGELIYVGLGVSPHEKAATFRVEAHDIATWVPPRPLHAHKGTSGHVLIVGGSEGRTGASLLSGLGALRGGAGLVTIVSRAQSSLDFRVTEMMTSPLPDTTEEGIRTVLDTTKHKNAVVLGPGLGLDASRRELAIALAQKIQIPTVLDADALTAIGEANLVSALKKAEGARVLTPHPGECSRLLGRTTEEIQSNRYDAAMELATKSGHVVVLKGALTVVATPSGTTYVCGDAHPALGVAGTGDVLSGVIAAYLVSASPEIAACVAVTLHSMAGRIAAVSDRGLLAHEVADALPHALERCRAPKPAAHLS